MCVARAYQKGATQHTNNHTLHSHTFRKKNHTKIYNIKYHHHPDIRYEFRNTNLLATRVRPTSLSRKTFYRVTDCKYVRKKMETNQPLIKYWNINYIVVSPSALVFICVLRSLSLSPTMRFCIFPYIVYFICNIYYTIYIHIYIV